MTNIVISRIQHRRGRRENLPQPLLPAEVALTSDTAQAWIGQDPSLAVPTINVYADQLQATAQVIVDANVVETRFDENMTVTIFNTFVSELKLAGGVTLVDDDILWDDTYRGTIETFTFNAAGTGYSVNDPITAISATGSGFTGEVSSVGGGGEITGVAILTGGINYRSANTTFSITSGGGGASGTITQLAVTDIYGSTVHIAANPVVDAGNTIANIDTTIDGLSATITNRLMGDTPPNNAAFGGIFSGNSLGADNHTEASNVVAIINRVNSTTPGQVTGLVFTNLNIEITGGGSSSSLTILDGTGSPQPIGFNTIPIYEIDSNTAFDIAHQGMLWHKDSGGTITFTCDDESSIPQGASWAVHNDDSENLTIAEGAGVTISFVAAGSAPVTGDVIITQGGIATIYKYTDTEYWVWGDVSLFVQAPATLITVADTADPTTFPVLVGNAVGDEAPLTDGGLTYNANTAVLSTTTFVGALTGTASGNVTSSSSPLINEIAVFTSGIDIAGDANLTYNSTTGLFYVNTTDGTTSNVSVASPGIVGLFAADASAATTAGGDINIISGIGNTTGDGGSVTITSGDSGAGVTGAGGSIAITSGASLATDGAGGAITINTGAGNGTGDGGDLALQIDSVEAIRFYAQLGPDSATDRTFQQVEIDTTLISESATSQGDFSVETTYNRISQLDGNGDAITLPAVFGVGTLIHLVNDVAAFANIYPASGDDLGQGVDTAEILRSGEHVTYIGITANSTWLRSAGPGNFDGLLDVDLASAVDNDLLFRSSGDWIDTAGALTWDGTSLSATQFGGIVEANLLDSGATETISAAWTFDDNIFILESASADADVLGDGQIWVRDDDPNTLMFTDDLGNDQQIRTSLTESVTGTNVIEAFESGKTFFLNLAAGFTTTLPVPAAGLKYKFFVATAPTSSGGYIITTNSGANILQGTFLDIVGELQAISAQDTLTFVFDVSLVGDSLEVESDGTSWFCTAFSKADGGITVSV